MIRKSENRKKQPMDIDRKFRKKELWIPIFQRSELSILIRTMYIQEVRF